MEGLDIHEHGMWGYPEQFMPVPGSEYRPATLNIGRPPPLGAAAEGGTR